MGTSSTGEPETAGPGDGPAEGDAGEKKISFRSDESWKAEAQKEKQRIQEKVEKETRELPPPSFLAFVGDLGLQAMLALGLAEIQGAGRPKRDLPAARYTIDLLGILQEKTRGNLTAEEKRQLDEILKNLRLSYVAVAKAESAEGKRIVEPGQRAFPG